MQLALAYDASTVGAGDFEQIRAWFSRAVDLIGAKEVAYKLDIAPSQLSDAQHERERKDLKLKWLSTVLRMCGESMVREFFEIVGKQHGYASTRVRLRTAEEELRETRELLRLKAPAMLDLLDKELGR